MLNWRNFSSFLFVRNTEFGSPFQLWIFVLNKTFRQDSRLRDGYENVPTRDIHMNQVNFERQWLYLLKEYVRPLQELVFLGYYHDVRYHFIKIIQPFLGSQTWNWLWSCSHARHSHDPSWFWRGLVRISQRVRQPLAAENIHRILGLRKPQNYSEVGLLDNSINKFSKTWKLIIPLDVNITKRNFHCISLKIWIPIVKSFCTLF